MEMYHKTSNMKKLLLILILLIAYTLSAQVITDKFCKFNSPQTISFQVTVDSLYEYSVEQDIWEKIKIGDLVVYKKGFKLERIGTRTWTYPVYIKRKEEQ